jgi:hypothetical protein
MPIRQEELNQRPYAVQLVLMEDPADPHLFGCLFRFPCGLNQVWTVRAPDTPIDDEWIRHAITKMVEAIVADLREGRSEPRIKRNKQAFREFDRHCESAVGALQAHMVHWARKRKKWAEALAAPTVIQ